MRWGLFLPRYDARTIELWNTIDNFVFLSALKHHPDIKVVRSRTGPCCILPQDRSVGQILMPVDPVKWGIQKLKHKKETIEKVSGVFRRNSLEHELAELKVARAKCSTGNYGQYMRAHKYLCGRRSDHVSIHPLVAELNASGRSIAGVTFVYSEWSNKPAQDKIFALLRQYGWTPYRGIPIYGRLSSKAQRAAERIFGGHYRSLIDTRMKHLERKYKGKALRRKIEEMLVDAPQTAGGYGLKQRYLKSIASP